MTNMPTDNTIADAIHAAAEVHGYGPEAVHAAAAALTRAGADEDERGAILAACQRVYRERMCIMEA